MQPFFTAIIFMKNLGNRFSNAKIGFLILLLFAIIYMIASSSQQDRSIDLIGLDFRFTPDTINVVEGETVLINFTNPDVVPHLIDLPDFTQHIALPPGGEFTLEFVADKTGSFPFVCSVPGHEEAGMIGLLIVVPAP